MARMTEERLEQYRALRLEVAQLKESIREIESEGPRMTSDSVTTAAEFPYSKHTITIKGVEDPKAYDRNLTRLKKQRDRSQAEIDEIDEYIAHVPDARIRTIMRWKYVDGWSWLKIAMRSGWQSESAPRLKIKFFLESNDFNDFNDL